MSISLNNVNSEVVRAHKRIDSLTGFNTHIVWSGSSRDITFNLPYGLTFDTIKMLNVVGSYSFSILTGQFTNGLVAYDNGVYVDGETRFERKSDTQGRVYNPNVGGDQGPVSFRSIAILY